MRGTLDQVLEPLSPLPRLDLALTLLRGTLVRKFLTVDQLQRRSASEGSRLARIVLLQPLAQVLGVARVEAPILFALQHVYPVHPAEREGFEPSTRVHRALAFQASSFSHSDTSPAGTMYRPPRKNVNRHWIESAADGKGMRPLFMAETSENEGT